MSDADEKTIIDLEKKFWQSMLDKDTETSISMLDGTSVVAGAQGFSVLSHDDYRGMAKQSEGFYELKSFKLDDMKVTFPTEEVAVIAYKARAEMTVEGKPMTMQAADATTWVKKNGKWLAALHTESLMGDPFGRDRKAA